MEDEFQKRNTDCVYFLASPLTCKKGVECEYRHSEIARLNPRDCWYWLAGSCLNPTCAFRHPPLESRAQTSSSAPSHNKSAVPVYKTNAPCYFYFNGYCSKGQRCSFLHGPDGGTPAWQSSKIASGIPDVPTAEKKTSAGSETGPATVEKHPNSSETESKAVTHEYIKSKADLHSSMTNNNIGEQSVSGETSGSPSEEATAVRSESLVPSDAVGSDSLVPSDAVGSDSLVPAEGFIRGGSHWSPDRSSDEEIESNVERDEWLESSPGFDVLVDDRVEGLSPEDDRYLVHRDMEEREYDERLAGYDIENILEYDPAYPDVRRLSEEELDDSYYKGVNHDINEYEHAREILIPAHGSQYLPWKRKLPRELAIHGRGNVDLRDLLKKQKVIDSDPPNHFSRKFDLPKLYAREQSRFKHQPQISRWMPPRLASKVESGAAFSRFKDGSTLSDGVIYQRRLRHSQGSSNREHSKDRRRGKSRAFANEVPRKMVSRKRSSEVRMIFSAPKSLAQIKEEKRKGTEDGNSFEKTEQSRGSERDNFLGPKPLSEILRDKRKLGSVVNFNN